jgi:hypothetical protein
MLVGCEQARVLDDNNQRDKNRPKHHYAEVTTSDGKTLTIESGNAYYDHIVKPCKQGYEHNQLFNIYRENHQEPRCLP